MAFPRARSLSFCSRSTGAYRARYAGAGKGGSRPGACRLNGYARLPTGCFQLLSLSLIHI
eukprot:3359179-Alexandrium_andersonii.AAC.1